MSAGSSSFWRVDAYDNEDGQLSGAALSWSSDLDGALGDGDSLTVNASTLAEGAHTITLTAQDSDGQTNSTAITVRVYRDRPVLPMDLSARPTWLNFMATEGGGQTAWQDFSIRNNGDGAMSWSASTDQAWIRVSSLERHCAVQFSDRCRSDWAARRSIYRHHHNHGLRRCQWSPDDSGDTLPGACRNRNAYPNPDRDGHGDPDEHGDTHRRPPPPRKPQHRPAR